MSEPLAESHSTAAESGWFVSLLFWLALFAAAALYAAVALAPKYLAYLEISREYYDNQVRLVGLQRQVAYLQKVGAALENDPQFAAELTRVEFDASRPGEERIPVERHLALDGRVPQPPSAVSTARLPWYAPLVVLAAENRRLRRDLLIAAGAIVLVAFTFLHESEAPRIRSAARMVHGAASTAFAPVRWLAARYRRDARA